MNRRPVRQFWNPKAAPVVSLGRHKTLPTLDLIVDLTSQRLRQPPSALQALQNRYPRPASNQKTSARVYRPRGAPRETHSRALDSNTEHRPSSHLTLSTAAPTLRSKQASKQASRSVDRSSESSNDDGVPSCSADSTPNSPRRTRQPCLEAACTAIYAKSRTCAPGILVAHYAPYRATTCGWSRRS